MTNTATRQQIEEVLAEFEGERISDALINDICSAIFRLPFQPKRGQVCMFSDDNKNWHVSVYVQTLNSGRFSDENSDVWLYARPLNSEELGE